MDFPSTIEEFGYHFNAEGQLRSMKTEEPFQFVVKENDQSFNQKHYEALGVIITDHIYKLLEEECGLQKMSVPLNGSEGKVATFIFCSKNFITANKLMLLIHGSGVVRAGQWARRLIINDCISSGTQIPFIKRALEEGYGIIVTNTNDNKRVFDGKTVTIPFSGTAEDHAVYVWKNFVGESQARHISIVAHSYGGVILTKLSDEFATEFFRRVFAVALTDSVHFRIPEGSKLPEIARNWVVSSEPLDEPILRKYDRIPCVSAGCRDHEMTSWSSFESIFRFFREKFETSVRNETLFSGDQLGGPPDKRPKLAEDRGSPHSLDSSAVSITHEEAAPETP